MAEKEYSAEDLAHKAKLKAEQDAIKALKAKMGDKASGRGEGTGAPWIMRNASSRHGGFRG